MKKKLRHPKFNRKPEYANQSWGILMELLNEIGHRSFCMGTAREPRMPLLPSHASMMWFIATAGRGQRTT
jgi:hypothetical protein